MSQLASQLDLNTLHSLSRTCRQFRANLLQYRDQLIRHTLHCEFEHADLGARLGSRLREAATNFQGSRQLTSGRVGKCARDMVAECQRCGTVVCRVWCLNMKARTSADRRAELHHQTAAYAVPASPPPPTLSHLLQGSSAAPDSLQAAPIGFEHNAVAPSFSEYASSPVRRRQAPSFHSSGL